jgi:hypothetical protein
VKKDCPSQRTYIATDDGYISASDVEDDGVTSDDAGDDAAIDGDAEGNYRFGGDVIQTIRLPINKTRTPQSQHHFSSSYQPCAARLTSP